MITNRPAGGSSGSAPTRSTLAVSGWPLRRKVALALAIPLVLAGTLGFLRVNADLDAAANSSASARQVTALRPAVDYLTAAEQAVVAAASEGGKAALQEALTGLRMAGADLRDAKETADLTADQRYQVDAVLDLSQALRADDAITLSPDTLVAQLRQLQSGVTQLISTIVNEQITPEPRLELLSQALAGRFSLAMQQALAATERVGKNASLELFSEFGAEGAAIERLAGALGASEESVAALRTANAQRFRTVRTGGTDLGGASAYADYDRVISNLQDGIDQELEAAATQARTDALVNAGITLAALVAAILLALLVSRLLLNPIRRVREGALAVAHEQLPEEVARIRAGEDPGEVTPIDVRTEEEIGQLARAVDDMHRQAVVLASGEASLRAQVSHMFVTLSRRSTSLVNQQLGLIERLERDEEDPKRLESLFRLDHLAARMRRTADSLLILADAPTATTVSDELTVGDALQAATAGVQDYQRVRIRSADATPIDGGAAADVIHLLTELVDNALTYSPPDSSVTLGSRTVGDGVVVEIADAGLGIPAGQLAGINDGLASGADITPDTARRMGLFVVSRLSKRHGIATSLRANEDGGTTATVVLPAGVLDGHIAPDAAPAPATTAVDEAPQVKPTPKLPPAPKLPQAPQLPQAPRVGELGKPRTPAAVPGKPAARDVGSVINASLGLPTRGQTAGSGSGAPAPVTPETAPAALAKVRPLRGDAPAATEAPAPVTPQPVLRQVISLEAGNAAASNGTAASANGAAECDGAAAESDGVAAGADGVAAALPSRAKAAGSKAAEPKTAEPDREPPGVDESDLPEPVVSMANDALARPWTDPGEDGSDTPIFKSLRSAWLSSGDDAQPWRTTEIEAGWQKAEEVVEAPPVVEVSESGLPMRRPGSRLMPGGVTDAPAAKVRDPEAVRARLAAHASGVSRGRAAASAADSSPMEAGS